MDVAPHGLASPALHAATQASERDKLLESVRRRYLELLRLSLLNETGLEAEAAYFFVRDAVESGAQLDDLALYDVKSLIVGYFERVREARASGRYFDRKLRNIGFAYTMIGRKRLDNIEHCVSSILAHHVPGDLVECGVWRGGAAIFMRGLLAAWGVSDRLVWLADSFAGLPKPESSEDVLDLSAERRPELAVDLDRVRRNFALFGLLDDQVRFLEGWFKDTLPPAPIGSIAVLRLDADLYESTMTALTALYDRVSAGGYVIVDDYNALPACRAAVTEFRADRGIGDPIVEIDWTGVYWQKSS
jgi:O-methyltransferase